MSTVCTSVFQTPSCCELNDVGLSQSWTSAKPKHRGAAPRGCAYVVLSAGSESTNNAFLLLDTMKPKSLCVPRLGLFEDIGGRYRRQVDTGAPEQSLDQPREKRPRDLCFTVLPERSQYEPLVEDDSQHKLKEEKKAKKKEKYKKYKKNVGKALRYSWKCLMLGLQNFTVGYSTPFSTAASIVPDFHPGGAWG